MKKVKKIQNLIQRPNLYDYLKVLAVVMMIIDHLGYYLFPEFEFLRWIGRFAFPIFLFLVGFNGKYQRKRPLMWWAIGIWGFMIGLRWLTGIGNFSANILVVIVLVRARLYFLNTISDELRRWRIIGSIVILIALHPQMRERMDYGSLWFFFALWGMLARNKSDFSMLLGSGALCALRIQNIIVFQFGYMQGNNTWVAALFGGYILLAYLFSSLAKKNSGIRLNRSIDMIILWISQHALSIYGIHIIFLGLVAVAKNLNYMIMYFMR